MAKVLVNEKVYWAQYETDSTKNDRLLRIEGKENDMSFFDWLAQERAAVEKLTGKPASIKNCKVFINVFWREEC